MLFLGNPHVRPIIASVRSISTSVRFLGVRRFICIFVKRNLLRSKVYFRDDGMVPDQVRSVPGDVITRPQDFCVVDQLVTKTRAPAHRRYSELQVLLNIMIKVAEIKN